MNTIKKFIYCIVTAIMSSFVMFASEPQFDYKAIHLKYGQQEHIYKFTVRDGTVNWSYSGEYGNSSDTFLCNKNVDGDVITTECVGIVYWYKAGEFFWNMAEELGEYDAIQYKRGKEALEHSLEYFSNVKKRCPDTYDRVLNNYQILIEADEGKRSLWDAVILLSYSLTENPLTVKDLYNYNF